MPFTEFCCRSGGSNLNAGTRTGNSTEPGTAADFTYASGTWVAATRTFTPVSGNPSTDGVAAGDFGSVWVDGSAVTGYVARVTSVTATTIVFSATALMGTAPADGVATRTCKIGGAWKGPNAADGFPLNILPPALTNSSGHPPRVNMKNDATYNITAAISNALTGPFGFEGYTTSYADGGITTVDGGTSGASYVLFTNTGSRVRAKNIIFQNNGATGSADGVSFGARALVEGCVTTALRGSGLVFSAPGTAIKSEAYACNQSNTAGKAGMDLAGSLGVRLISHDNSGSNSAGIRTAGFLSNSISDSNGGDGVVLTGTNPIGLKNVDSNNNGGDGIDDGGSNVSVVVDSCNLIANGGFGIRGTGLTVWALQNNGYSDNVSGTTSFVATAISVEINPVNYGVGIRPWVDAPNGDFRINLAAAKGTGRGTYTQTAPSYAGTIGYPDIGAAQHQETAGGGLKLAGRGGLAG